MTVNVYDFQHLPTLDVRAEDLRPTAHGVAVYSRRLTARYPEAEEGDMVAVAVFLREDFGITRRLTLGRIAQIDPGMVQVILQPSGRWSTR